MSSILIRCDASLSIGSGHVIRCRTLARELRRRGATVTFICRSQCGDLINLLEQEFSVLVLPERPLAAMQMPQGEPLKGREFYAAWLGCSQEQDAADCLLALTQAAMGTVHWLVVDHYGLDAQWEAHLLAGLAGDAAPRLLVIDDLADRPHQADLLLDQNFFGPVTETRYVGLVPDQCRQLLGPHYALLGPEYAQLHPLLPPRAELRRVLVFFGGVDSANLTGRALEALFAPELADLAVDVVLGLQCPHRQVVEELVARRPQTTLHNPQPSLAGLIARADLTIGAGGATTWERACLGLPSLVITIADNQIPFVQALVQAGKVQLLGSAAAISAEQIRLALMAAIQQRSPRASGQDLTDGWGVGRVATAVMGLQRPLQLRPATAADEALLLRWANEPQASANSFSREPIAPGDHHHWFQEGLANANRSILIASDSAGCPIGQIRFERQPPGSIYRVREALIELLLDRCARGLGLATDLLTLGLRAIEQQWGPDTEAVSEVLESNAASHATFAKVGFRIDDLSNPPPAPRPVCDTLALAPSRITLLSDDGSWLNQHLPHLIAALWRRGHAVRWIHQPAKLAPGDVCLLLSCGRLLSTEQLSFHRHNLVVHESALPHGQGWSPMTWQILEGSNCIPITLFEATPALDAGPIYLQSTVELTGTELVDEWRALQAEATINLCLNWLDRYTEVISLAKPQQGEASHYRRRRPTDSQLDPQRTLAEQMNLLRVVDNQRYPALMEIRGRRYEVLIRPAPFTHNASAPPSPPA
jgi:UDP-2,4-diacetamido-2,4,6-trideoxy-beta-L-altropyranose hydrolase